LTDRILSAVHHLVREDGPFTSALVRTQDTSTAIAEALETVAADVRPSSPREEGGVARLEALLHAGDLSTFYANVVVSLVVEALSGGDAQRLATIRRVAMRILPRSVVWV
jgi:hypothetical protein